MNRFCFNFNKRLISLNSTRKLSTSKTYFYPKVNDLSLKGIFPPIPTPFSDINNKICYEGLQRNFETWKDMPLSGYVVQGSNGEYPFLTSQERVELVKKVKEMAANKLLIAGSGCESTDATIEMSNKMGDNGADAALVITPCYYKSQMTSSIFLSHFEKVADKSQIPIILYNMPGNTGVNIPIDVVVQLAQHPNCIGMKESGGDIVRISQIVHQTIGCDFQVVAGSASFLQASCMVGAVGAIAALANVLGNEVCQLYDCCQSKNWEKATLLQYRLLQPNAAVTTKYGVSGLKATLDWIGMYGGKPRLPLQPLENSSIEDLKIMFQSNGFFTDCKN